jgi:hypothetical protein
MWRPLGILFLIALLTACNETASAPTETPRGGALPESVSVASAAATGTPTTTRQTATPTTAAGSQTKKGTAQPTRKPTLTPTAGPTIQFTSVQGGSPSGIASVAIKGPPNTECTIAYFTPARTRSQAPGLAPMTTDKNGLAIWTWTIAKTTRPGMGRLDVACGAIKGSARITISQ